jgi:NAD(P)-dependent dehydrogenase (short-subunit alcohol dehydrogenase family)
MNVSNQIVVVIGAGSIGQAIARRISAGKQVMLADLRQENAEAAAKVMGDAGFLVSTTVVDISSRASVRDLAKKAASLGQVSGLIHAAGFLPPKRRRTSFSKSISTAPRSF